MTARGHVTSARASAAAVVVVGVLAATSATFAALAMGCGAHPGAPASTATDAPAPVEIILYRNVALVRTRIEVDIAAGASQVELHVAPGVTRERFTIVDSGGLQIDAIAVRPALPEGDDEPAIPTTVALSISGSTPGHYRIGVAYATEAIEWEADYSLLLAQARTRGTLRGAARILNLSGVDFARAQVVIVDTPMPSDGVGVFEHAKSVAPIPRDAHDLGVLRVPRGELRVELATGAPAAIHPVVIYDPIGTRLDHLGDDTVLAPTYGVVPAAPTTVANGYELTVDPATATLPGGRVQLVEQAATGALVLVGEARVFDTHAPVVAFAVGTADGVTGHRERRDLTFDETAVFDSKPEHKDRKRLFEELAITVDNARAVPVDVVVREHLYRGQTWNLVYYSAPTVAESSQQIAMRTTVPAHGHALLTYVVTYPW